MALGSQGISRLLVVFRSISDVAGVFDDVDVIVDEASTALNVTQDSKPRYSAWAMRPERITKASTSYGPPRNSESTNDLRPAGSSPAFVRYPGFPMMTALLSTGYPQSSTSPRCQISGSSGSYCQLQSTISTMPSGASTEPERTTKPSTGKSFSIEVCLSRIM